MKLEPIGSATVVPKDALQRAIAERHAVESAAIVFAFIDFARHRNCSGRSLAWHFGDDASLVAVGLDNALDVAFLEIEFPGALDLDERRGIPGDVLVRSLCGSGRAPDLEIILGTRPVASWLRLRTNDGHLLLLGRVRGRTLSRIRLILDRAGPNNAAVFPPQRGAGM